MRKLAGWDARLVVLRREMMRQNRVRLGLLVLVLLLLVVAWFDGGREPQRMIEQPVELAPEAPAGGAAG